MHFNHFFNLCERYRNDFFMKQAEYKQRIINVYAKIYQI